MLSLFDNLIQHTLTETTQQIKKITHSQLIVYLKFNVHIKSKYNVVVLKIHTLYGCNLVEYKFNTLFLKS